MFVKLVMAVLIVLACSCGVPCTPVDRSQPQEVCHPLDGGELIPGQPFALMATTELVAASCSVAVDGGQVGLFISGTNVCSRGGGFAKPASPTPVRCEVPALPEGSYTLNTVTPQSFTLPDAGLPSCP